MNKPRTTFAAPFVLVIACGQPHEHTSAPHHHRHRRAKHVEVPVDAGMADAAVDAPPDAREVSIEEKCSQPWKYNIICNPAPPAGPVPPGYPGYRPPPSSPIEASVIGVRVDGGATLVTLNRGWRDGVDPGWHVALGDAKIDCRIVDVLERSTVCKLTATDVTATKAILRK